MRISRHAKIIELINRYDIGTQQELTDRLKEEGFPVTQATVSRDIRVLKLTKVTLKNKKHKYEIAKPGEDEINEKYIQVLQNAYVSMGSAQNILVIKTVSGMAMAVAASIDALKWKEVVGCIAGDDTIMCAVRTTDETMEVMNKIQTIISEKQEGR